MLHERKGGHWRLHFTFKGRKHFLAFGRVTREKAEQQAAEATALLRRVRSGELTLPEGMGIATYLFLGGVTPEEYRQTQELNELPPR